MKFGPHVALLVAVLDELPTPRPEPKPEDAQALKDRLHAQEERDCERERRMAPRAGWDKRKARR